MRSTLFGLIAGATGLLLSAASNAQPTYQFVQKIPGIKHIAPAVTGDPSLPGPNRLIGGTLQAGFFGEVSVEDFIDGKTLASRVGLTQGAFLWPDAGWLKFSYAGKTLYLAKKEIKSSWSGNNIYLSTLTNLNLIDGGKILEIGDHTYKVRLLSCADTSPATAETLGGEWNALIYPISATSPVTEKWASYPDEDIAISGNHYTTCKESYESTLMWRGNQGVESFGSIVYLRWRPVLEVVQ